VIAPNTVDTDLVNGKALLGCRVPTLIVSPLTRGNPAKPRINSLLYDHTSVLKLIEWRWGLSPLTARDASSEIANLASALNFNELNTSIPSLPVISEPVPEPCFNDTFETLSATTGLPEINAPQAEQVSQTENSNGADEEIYDFYLMLKSDLMQGWPLPANLIGL
jgi:phospholipase C